MPTLAPQVAGSLLASLLVGAVFLYLRGHDRADYLKFWAWASFCTALRHGFSILNMVDRPSAIYDACSNTAVVLAGAFLLLGVYHFLERPVRPIWYIFAVPILIWTPIAALVETNFWIATGPAFFFRGLTDIGAGAAMLHRRDRVGATIAGISFVLWGIHRLNFPFLRPVEWFAPWGFELAAFLAISVAIGIMMAHFESARDQANQREREFRALFENAVDGMFRAEHTGKLAHVNSAFAAILGRDPKDLEGSDIRELIGMSPDEVPHGGIEQTWQRADGRNVFVKLEVRHMTESDTSFFEGSVRDVTQTRLLTEQLDLARKMDALGRLAGGVAHDFNNILTAILGAVDLAEMEIHAGRSPSQNLAIVRLSARRAAELAVQLLAFSKQRGTEKSAIDVDHALADAEAMLMRLLPDNIDLVFRKDARNLHTFTESGQIERVVLNLAVNAQDAMPNGGLLEIASKPAGNDVMISVRDNGTGMDPEVLQQIFEPYFSTKSDKGTGLGLANVYKIVESMGGKIDVKSAIGDGSEFIITLPTIDAPVAPRQVPTARASWVEGSPLVLLVEDRDFVRRSTSEILRRSGYRVLAAKDGEQALQLVDGKLDEVSVVLSDVMMSRMGGFDLIVQLRMMRPDIRCVLTSGHHDDPFDRVGDSPYHFLHKPYSTNELLEKLHEVRTQSL